MSLLKKGSGPKEAVIEAGDGPQKSFPQIMIWVWILSKSGRLNRMSLLKKDSGPREAVLEPRGLGPQKSAFPKL